MDDLKTYINKLREDFTQGMLSESDVDPDPSQQFKLWLQQAVESRITEVQAMTLATVSEKGRPSSRIVYLREFESNKFWFYTNYASKKARELSTVPFASITFFWKELERQVRIEGRVTKADTSHSDAYFNARPYDSKVGAWASPQSQPLNSRDELEKKVIDLSKKFSPESIKRPDHWGGYVVYADYYEFWQGRKSRLHDRISYTLKESLWELKRLAP
jgi:pyridoxamine 5'-phosphate oxidase